jgi:hypothetical protein
MSATLLRFGLYLLVILLVLFVIDTAYENSALHDFVNVEFLQKAMGFAVLLTVAGAVLRVLEGASRKVTKSRCTVCRTPVTPGAIYCRQHLRNILADEDDRTHHTRNERLR